MIAHNKPTLGDREAEAAASTVRSGWVARGPQVRAFEEELGAFLGLPGECVAATSSGTAALFLALHVLEVRSRGVALPAYACAALRNAAAMAGATHLAIDCASAGPNVDANAVVASRCEFAIVPHMYGIPADVREMGSRVAIVDDAAQALGARIGEKPAGLNGRAGIFSFYATKLMTTGGNGGAVVSADRALMAAVHDYLDFDCRRDERARFNFQLGDVQAAVGRVQLTRLPEFLARRAEIFRRYAALGFPMLQNESQTMHATPFRAVVRTDGAQALIAHLARAGVQAIVPTQDWELPAGAFPNALRLAASTVSLPLYPSLSDADVQTVCDALSSAA